MDIFPDGLIRLGRVSERNFIIRLWKKLSIAALKRSEKIIVIGRDMKQWMTDVYTEGLDKTEYIPLWQDSHLINPIEFEKNDFVREHDLQADFKFILIDRIMLRDYKLSAIENFTLLVHSISRLLCISDVKALHLDRTITSEEKVPITINQPIEKRISRIS